MAKFVKVKISPNTDLVVDLELIALARRDGDDWLFVLKSVTGLNFRTNDENAETIFRHLAIAGQEDG